MNPIVRALLLWVGGIASITAPLAVYSALQPFSSPEVFEVLDVFRIATVATMLWFMFPAAYFGSNNGEWGQEPEFEVFMLTFLVTLSLFVVFPVNKRAVFEALMDKDIPYIGFFLLWWVHGGINAFRVRILRRRAQSAFD
jgi:hypothetical protein